MKKIKCFDCGVMLKGPDAYHAHRADHQSGKLKARVDQKPTSVGSVPMPEELAGTLLPKEDEKPVKTDPKPLKEAKKPIVDNRTPPKIKAEAPRLEYKYEGRCTKCGKEVETLVLDDIAGKNEVVVVAWCGEHKKIRQRIAVKL